jgi:hypothetical protein
VYRAFSAVAQRTNHTFQLCSRHPIHNRHGHVLWNAHKIRTRSSNAAPTLWFHCDCLAQVRDFCLSSEEALTPWQHVSMCMRQYHSNTLPCCHIIDLQCSLSDSVLAWRCYVIFGKRRWLKWTLTIVVLVITSACQPHVSSELGLLLHHRQWYLLRHTRSVGELGSI